MKRLTIKIDKGYITDDTKCMHNKYIDKLGRLEDLEEELGCPLRVVLKALKRGYVYTSIYTEDGSLVKYDITHLGYGLPIGRPYTNPEFCLEEFLKVEMDRIFYSVGYVVLKDYKITWWLRKDMSE